MSEPEPIQHRFRSRDGVLQCVRPRCGTVWGEGPADCLSPINEWAERLRELTDESARIAQGPDVGEAEVRRLGQILDEAQQILDDSGVTAEEERRALARRMHLGRGQAIDIPPRRDLFDWIRRHYDHGPGHIYDHGPGHIHN